MQCGINSLAPGKYSFNFILVSRWDFFSISNEIVSGECQKISLVDIFRLSNGDTKPQLTDILVENYFPVKPGKCTYYSTAI